MSEVLSVAPVEAPAAPAAPAAGEIEALAALIPDSAVRTDAPSVVTPGAERTDIADIQNAQAKADAADAPAEVAPVEEPPPSAEDADALARAEAAAKRAREGSRRYREMLENQQRQAAEAERVRLEAQRLRQEAEQARRLREDLTKDPYAALKKLGMTEQELAERALREGTPEAKLYEYEQRLEAERQARLALENRLQQERQAMAQQVAEQKFFAVADNEAAYPRLAALEGPTQLAIARAALQQIANNGYEVTHLTDAQVAEACERFLAPKKGAGKAAPAAKPAPAAAKPPPAKPAAKTLTNSVAAEKAVTPKAWDELSEDEQIAQIAALLPDS